MNASALPCPLMETRAAMFRGERCDEAVLCLARPAALHA